MKYLLFALVILAAGGLWYVSNGSLTGTEKEVSSHIEAAPRDPEENISGNELVEENQENFIEEGTTTPPDTEDALESVKSKIANEEETPELRAQLLGEYYDNNANKQEVFELTTEILQSGPPPVLFEKALYTHARFLGRSEQQNLYGEMVKKYSDPKIRKILEKFAAKNEFSQNQE